jgi:uncharacterized UPF0160 family protein
MYALLLVAVCQDDKKNWRIQSVSVGPGSFVNRRGLPTAWRGMRDADLDAVCETIYHSGNIE